RRGAETRKIHHQGTKKMELRAFGARKLLGVLVLLRHKLRRLRAAFVRAQQGHRGALLTRATIRRRRMVAIELGM
ncbi:MAG: hypothetical protein ACRET3_14235, partial [Burkholderiales bacterium]